METLGSPSLLTASFASTSNVMSCCASRVCLVLFFFLVAASLLISWMLAAMDKRIAAAVPICGVCTYRSLRAGNAINRTGIPVQTYLDSHSIYYYTPSVLRLAEQQDLCALIAPRPFALVGANRDDCFPLDGMRECARDLKHVYQLLGAPQNFRYVEFEGLHSIPPHSRKTAYTFFRKHLDGK